MTNAGPHPTNQWHAHVNKAGSSSWACCCCFKIELATCLNGRSWLCGSPRLRGGDDGGWSQCYRARMWSRGLKLLSSSVQSSAGVNVGKLRTTLTGLLWGQRIVNILNCHINCSVLVLLYPSFAFYCDLTCTLPREESKQGWSTIPSH